MACYCSCLAGLDEAYTHVAAILVTIEATVPIRDAQTVTQRKAYWMLPPVLREVPYKPVCEINFTAPKAYFLSNTYSKMLSQLLLSRRLCLKFKKIHIMATQFLLFHYFKESSVHKL